MIDELKDVLELATGATKLVKEILDLKPNNKNSNENELILSNKKRYAQIGSSGYSAKIGSSGYSAKIGSSGDSAKIGSSGDYAKIGSSGDSAKIGSSGDYAQIGSSGDSAKIESTGNLAVVSGIGFKSIAKAKKGSWITLAEYKLNENDNWVVDFVKTEQVDGERIKEDTFYTLYNHEFTEVQIIDEIRTIVLNRKKNVIKGLYLDNLNSCFVVEKDGVFSHGKTIKEAKDSLLYKISNRDTSMYEDYTLNTKVKFEEAVKMYRCITGACEAGTRHFVENVLTNKKKSYTIQEIIDATQGQYGSETFRDFFNN